MRSPFRRLTMDAKMGAEAEVPACEPHSPYVTTAMLSPLADTSGNARPVLLKVEASGSFVLFPRYALTASAWYEGCAKKLENPPPLVKTEPYVSSGMTATSGSLTVPLGLT